MNIWYPLTKAEFAKQSPINYVNNCKLDLYVFKSILKNQINVSKCQACCEGFSKCFEKLKVDSKKVREIINEYINRVQCYYDISSERCYYTIPKEVLLKGTSIPLITAIKILEFGNDKVAPMNLLRHSFMEFQKYLYRRGLH